MRRRTFVAACGTAALAGCFGSGDEEDGGSNTADNDTPEDETVDDPGEEENESEENESEDDGSEEQEEDADDQVGATDPEPLEFSGTGPATTEQFEVSNGLTLLDVSPIEGMQVDVVDSSGSTWRSLDWDLRNYQGMVPIEVPTGEYELQIQSEVQWTVRVIEPDVTPDDIVEPGVTVRGSGSEYIGPVNFGEGLSASFTHEGTGEISLKVLAADGEYIGDAIDRQGTFEDTAEINYLEQGWLLVTTNADWELTLEDAEDVQGGLRQQTQDDDGNEDEQGSQGNESSQGGQNN